MLPYDWVSTTVQVPLGKGGLQLFKLVLGL